MAEGLVTIISSENPSTLGKTYSLATDGTLTKTTAGQMVAGAFEVRAFSSAEDLATLLSGITTAQALCSSVPVNGQRSGSIATKATATTRTDAITRTKAEWQFAAAPGLLVLDYDAPQSGQALGLHAVWRALVEMCPALAIAGVVGWFSGSSLIYSGDDQLTGERGSRLYVLIQDGKDTPRAIKALAARAWLHGHGRIEVSAAGSLLERSLFDEAMSQTARLDFIGGAVCSPPLSQRRGSPLVLGAGSFIDSRSAIPDLSPDEATTVEALIAKAKATASGEARTKRDAWMASRVAEALPALIGQGVAAGEAEETVRRVWQSAFAGTLLGSFALTLVDESGAHEAVTVAQVLANPERYDGRDCLDPLNPEHRGGAADCRLYLLGASPIAYSLDDGGQVYHLRQQATRLTFAKGQRAALVDSLVAEVRNWPDVFKAGCDLVQVDGGSGGVKRLTPQRLSLLIDSRCALYVQGSAGKTAATDVQKDIAELVLTALQ